MFRILFGIEGRAQIHDRVSAIQIRNGGVVLTIGIWDFEGAHDPFLEASFSRQDQFSLGFRLISLVCEASELEHSRPDRVEKEDHVQQDIKLASISLVGARRLSYNVFRNGKGPRVI